MGWLKDLFSNEEEKEDHFEEEFSKLGDYPDNEEKWIDIDITIMTPYSELIKLKSALKPYAEELGWKIESDTNTEIEDNIKVGGGKIKRVNITLSPKDRAISPINFLNNKEKIMGLVFSIHRDIVHGGNHNKAVKDFRHTINITYTRLKGNKPSKEDYIIRESVSFLNYSYKLIDRIKFEKRNKKLALELFERTVEEDIKSIFKEEPKKEKAKTKSRTKKSEEELKFEKQFEESGKRMKEEMRDLFGFKFD